MEHQQGWPARRVLSPADRHGLARLQIRIVRGVVAKRALGLGFGDVACVTTARQVVGGCVAAASATPAHSKPGFEIRQRRGSGSDGLLNLAFGDRITYANKHENNYQLDPWNRARVLMDFLQLVSARLQGCARLSHDGRLDAGRLPVFRHRAARNDNALRCQ